MSNAIDCLREQAFQAQKGLCYYCDHAMWVPRPGIKDGPRRYRCTAEHLEPKSEGGRNSRDNIAAACYFCNSTRHKAKRPKAPPVYRSYVQRRLGKGQWHDNK